MSDHAHTVARPQGPPLPRTGSLRRNTRDHFLRLHARHLAATAALIGDAPAPHVARGATDGEALAHTWSANHEAYDEEFSAILRAMENLWPNANVIFMAPPDSVSIAPSREALILTDGTMVKAELDNTYTEAAALKGVLAEVRQRAQAEELLARRQQREQHTEASGELV